MESKNDLNNNIRLTTLKIQEEYPELIKYINKIPRNLQNNTEKGVSHKALKDYLVPLNILIETHAKEH